MFYFPQDPYQIAKNNKLKKCSSQHMAILCLLFVHIASLQANEMKKIEQSCCINLAI